MTSQDSEHLRLLSIFQFVYAGLMGLMALIPIIHVSLGVAIVSGAMGPSSSAGGPPAMMGWFFIVLGAAIIVLGLLNATLNVMAALFLRRRTHRIFCIVVAAFDCLNMPLGTALGIFTLIVLVRPGVSAAFARPERALPYANG